MYEAVASRRSVCGFTDRPVPREVLERVLSAAARTSSAPDFQPRRVYVLTERPLAELEKLVGERDAADDPWGDSGCTPYPAAPKPPYHERGSALGAPAVLFCYVDRGLGPAQWSDVGMYLQTVMLLLRAEGLHSCTQMAWAKYHRTVAEVLSPPDELALFCGLSIGFEDATVSDVRMGRVAHDATVTVVDAMDLVRRVRAPAEVMGSTEAAEAAATRSTSALRSADVGALDPGGRHAYCGRRVPRVVARLNDALVGRIRRIMSQVGLPP
ncbi:nitroreductase [Streptomyces sp. NPDC020766]|uniref:nitroreductase n=1 Tax=Streptomyces sp. NPDC020766 TaxID=3155011 RepID=UPI0033E99FD3